MVTEIFIPQVKSVHPDETRKVLLLLDNASSHPSADELNLIDATVHVNFLSK